MKSPWHIFFSQIHRECLLNIRKPFNLIHPWMFFIMVIFLFPFVLSQETQHLSDLIPGLFWISALFSYLLSIERFFDKEEENGCLDNLLIYPFPLPLSVLAKMLTHWLLTGLPLTILAPFLAYYIGLSWIKAQILFVGLLLGTPAFSALGILLSAITLSMTSRGLLLAILLIPISIPIVIFGTGSVLAENMGISSTSSLAFLAAISITTWLGVPFATSAALRLK